MNPPLSVRLLAAAAAAASLLSALPPARGGETPPIGRLAVRTAREIASSPWSIGGETLDRDFADYARYKSHLGPLGAKHIRLQAGWAKCERVAGVYDWAWLDEIVNDAVAQGVKPWLETSYGNTIYPGGGGTGLAGGMPGSEEALAAWDAWVRALVRRYRDRVDEWEVWNEPDIGKENTPEQYAAFFIRTASIVREEQKGSRVYALGLAGKIPFAEKFLDTLAREGETGLVDAITIHGYPRNPDDTSNLDKLREAIAARGLRIEVRQGETGAPSRFQEHFALSKIEWSENTQAKWNLRRMLAHHAQGVAFNLFTLSDMHYAQDGAVRMNYKGLLGTKADQSVSHVKPSYLAAQRVFGLFDDTLERVPGFGCAADPGLPLAAHAWRNKETGAVVVALWRNDAPPVESNATTPAGLVLSGVKLSRPVVADLLTGEVRDLPGAGDGVSFPDVPLYDSPVLIADKAALRLVEGGTP